MVVVAAIVFVPTLLLAGQAGAQDGDPYGGTTTTAPPSGGEVNCDLSTNQGGAGADVTATVAGVPLGDTVRVLFGGIEVGRATAAETAGQANVTTVQIHFAVPNVAGGTYLVAAVGSAFTAECSGDFQVLGPSVLGSTVQREGVTGSSSNRLGSLPKTGVYIALLIAIALALLLAGRALVRAEQRRK